MYVPKQGSRQLVRSVLWPCYYCKIWFGYSSFLEWFGLHSEKSWYRFIFLRLYPRLAIYTTMLPSRHGTPISWLFQGVYIFQMADLINPLWEDFFEFYCHKWTLFSSSHVIHLISPFCADNSILRIQIHQWKIKSFKINYTINIRQEQNYNVKIQAYSINFSVFTFKGGTRNPKADIREFSDLFETLALQIGEQQQNPWGQNWGSLSWSNLAAASGWGQQTLRTQYQVVEGGQQMLWAEAVKRNPAWEETESKAAE